MKLNRYSTKNPAFSNYFWKRSEDSSETLSVQGVVIKTLLGLSIVALVTVGIWYLHQQGADVSWFTLGGMLSSLVIGVAISYKPTWASWLVPIYAIAKGCFLGGFSAYMRAKNPELPYQAIGVTVITFLTVLFLYQTRIIKVTKTIKTLIITAASSIFMVYIISWILSLFDIRSFVWGSSWWALAFNVIAAIIAAFTLLLDFDFIERKKGNAPKSKEWFAAWGLLVSLVWLYTEVLRLLNRTGLRS